MAATRTAFIGKSLPARLAAHKKAGKTAESEQFGATPLPAG
jgi:hypothetical protein